MNFANRIFRNNKTGETIKVIDTFENIAVLENRQKIDTNLLINSDLFTEQIDPSSFLEDKSAFNILAERIKNIPLDNIIDDSPTRPSDSFKPSFDDSAIIDTISVEDEIEELKKKYSIPNQIKTNDSLAEYLEEDAPVSTPIYNQTQNTIQQIDPIISIFKNAKKNIDFNMSIDIKGKIPRIDFIEMMEDSYNTSIIDYLADEFTNELISNPTLIRDNISSKIRDMVFGSKPKPKRTRTKKQTPNND